MLRVNESDSQLWLLLLYQFWKLTERLGARLVNCLLLAPAARSWPDSVANKRLRSKLKLLLSFCLKLSANVKLSIQNLRQHPQSTKWFRYPSGTQDTENNVLFAIPSLQNAVHFYNFGTFQRQSLASLTLMGKIHSCQEPINNNDSNYRP